MISVPVWDLLWREFGGHNTHFGWALIALCSPNNGLLPDALRDLSSCIKEDGNDGALAGTLKQPDAEDLLDFNENTLELIWPKDGSSAVKKLQRVATKWREWIYGAE